MVAIPVIPRATVNWHRSIVHRRRSVSRFSDVIILFEIPIRRALSGLGMLASTRIPMSVLGGRRMILIANCLVAVVAALHVYFLVLEMFLWTKPLGLKTFRNTIEK